jgi:mRNA interferase RelE/StbE
VPDAYSVEIAPSAFKEIEKLSVPIARRIMDRIVALGANPRPPGCKRLGGRDEWRIRVADHRIVYKIFDAQLVVLTVAVGHRREIYRDF